MSFDWIKFIEVANKLFLTKKESFFRSAISRAYYAAFNKSRAYVEIQILGRSLENKDIHKEVILNLKNSHNPFIKEVGRKLDRIRTRRTDSDYISEMEMKEPDADFCILNANNIIEELKRRTPYTQYG